MILYDLKCRKDHVFETWFRDSAAYEEQVAAGAISCPTCGSRKIEKALMAPRLAKSGRNRDARGDARGDARQNAQGGPEGGPKGRPGGKMATRAVKETAESAELMGQLRELRKKVEENCDYVGGNFAEEARKIHYGEEDPRNIYGETSDEQAEELHEEGVSFNRIPWAPRHNS
ncbi:MAG: DUF1178 family protein [Alphaproteobacteria bacterium]